MNITCVIDSLGGGGAEKVMTYLASGLAKTGHNVTIVTLNSEIPDIYCVPLGVRHVKASGYSSICRWFNIISQIKRISVLRKYVAAQKPELIISFIDITNILVLIAFAFRRIPIIVSERINPAFYHIGLHWALLRKIFYLRAARVVMQTADALQWAKSNNPGWKTVFIPNPVVKPSYTFGRERPQFLGNEHNILALGRLHPQKGFDLLIKVFAGLTERFPNWHLTILGEGPERKKLESLAEKLDISGDVSFPGFSRNLYDAFRYVDLFVLSSRFEGFPNVLAEAMSCGVACISFDCPSGPGTIIRNGVDGLLVDNGDSAALSVAMGTLMSDENMRHRFAAKAVEVVERFSMEKYIDAWNKLLSSSR